MAAVLNVAEKRAGRVLTPETLARVLCRWAIRSPQDVTLDLGVGEGAFALAAYDRLRELGADQETAANHIYGAESDERTFARAQERACEHVGSPLPNVVCAGFEDVTVPVIDAAVGNPPYIRRHYQQDPGRLRAGAGRSATGLTDAYCYFLARAAAVLRPGGRMAVIVSSSWLDMRYGEELKRLLLRDFRLHLFLAFEGRLFRNALVKPLVLLAEKVGPSGTVAFGRLSHTAPLSNLEALVAGLPTNGRCDEVSLVRIDQAELSPKRPWSLFLKTPEVYEEVSRVLQLVPLATVAQSRIGLQTFAKGFFILTRADATSLGIEDDYLFPLAFSPRDVSGPEIAAAHQAHHVVFACSAPLAVLDGTGAARYIRQAMNAEVRVRGKDQTVRGYQEAPRLKRAGRRPWYNLRSEVARRGVSPILLPRRIFETYAVLHNAAGVIANEDFIEVRPLMGQADVVPLLAFLNSSLGELIVRLWAFQYGGGVFNLNPGAVRHLPVFDPRRLTAGQRVALQAAWRAFVAEQGNECARQNLDLRLAQVLNLSADLCSRVQRAVELLVGLALSARHVHRDRANGDAGA